MRGAYRREQVARRKDARLSRIRLAGMTESVVRGVKDRAADVSADAGRFLFGLQPPTHVQDQRKTFGTLQLLLACGKRQKVADAGVGGEMDSQLLVWQHDLGRLVLVRHAAKVRLGQGDAECRVAFP
jgi:hypothetical protein